MDFNIYNNPEKATSDIVSAEIRFVSDRTSIFPWRGFFLVSHFCFFFGKSNLRWGTRSLLRKKKSFLCTSAGAVRLGWRGEAKKCGTNSTIVVAQPFYINYEERNGIQGRATCRTLYRHSGMSKAGDTSYTHRRYRIRLYCGRYRKFVMYTVWWVAYHTPPHTIVNCFSQRDEGFSGERAPKLKPRNLSVEPSTKRYLHRALCVSHQT